ncbi:uncharacterized protein At4g26485 [Spinacia oleracea]|uniref:Uncharacterized protein At4g26485 n=1 Tax=Spinacia oleracea TaxID=3562 RepID=A0ABM3RRT5_SPIOL|nr:uncharacterized protein At4g26485-like [Spinacia oleracea]
MGQILSNLWSWICPKPRNEAPTSYDNQGNYQTFPHDVKQPQTHIINIPDHHFDPILGSGRNEIIESYDNNKLSDPSSSDIVVDLSSGYEDVKRKEKKKKAVIDDGDQVIEEVVVLEKKVTTRISHVSSVKKIGLYNSSQRILLVGEGDFSFSACLAVAFGTCAVNITATSLNSEDFLIKNYTKFITNKTELLTRGSTVIHDVDATKMAKHPILGCLLFDRIIFNFPHTGKFGRNDTDQRTHKNLVRGFMRNAKKMVKEDGEIHITSKSNGFFLEWDIPKIGSDQGLNLIKEVKFTRNKYPGYHTKYGFGGDKDFDCNPSKTYTFTLSLK